MRTTRSGNVRRRAFAMVLVAPVAVHAADRAEAIEEVVIVGSRIEKPDYAYSNPVISVDADSLRMRGTIDVATYLKDIPALVGSVEAPGGSNSIGATGLSLLNLRNLGAGRTLVLVDGRRHVAGQPGTEAVDIDTIPNELIERVDILTGGASAIYGADGVSGVVNFVMKRNFEGFTFRAQGNRSDQSDADASLMGFTAGKNFNDDRTNVSFAAEITSNDRLKAHDRDFARNGNYATFVFNPNDFGGPMFTDDPNLPDYVPLTDVRQGFVSRAGGVITDYDFSPTFDFSPDYNGNDVPWNGGSPLFNGLQKGGSGTPLADYIGDLAPKEDRETFNLFAHHEFSAFARAFGELKYSKNTSTARDTPSFDYTLFLAPDYAYTPPNIEAAANGNFLLVNRDHFDLGRRGERIERETLRGVVGVDGDLADGWRYEVSYVYGATDITDHILNNRLNDRFAAALDAVVDPATGEIVCRSNLFPSAEPTNISLQQDVIEPGWNDFAPRPGTWAATFQPGPNSGCVPLNILGENVASAAARDWINATTKTHSEITQQVVQAYVTGNSQRWFVLPAGPIGVAAGVEYRDERSSNVPDDWDRAGYTFFNIIEPTHGDFHVNEAFIEVDVPLLTDVPGFQALSIDGAYRVSDYSTIGTADTWKVGMGWQVIDDVRFRGTLAEATRAPNINELFRPGEQTYQFISDPCDFRAAARTTYTKANCAAILAPLGIDPATFSQTVGQVSGLLRGNDNLSEEVADTKTVGVIVQPRFVKNLTLSLDWYDIKINDAVTTAGPQTSAQQCVDLRTIDNAFCPLIERNATSGQIVSFVQMPLNVAQYRTQGYDFTVNYLLEPGAFGLPDGIGSFNFHLLGNHLMDLTFIDLPGAAPRSPLRDAGAPTWQTLFDLTWRLEPFVVNYGFSYFDETRRVDQPARRSQPDVMLDRYLDYRSRFVQNVYVSYSWENRVTLGGGVNNLANANPSIGSLSYPNGAIGRSYFLSLTMRPSTP